MRSVAGGCASWLTGVAAFGARAAVGFICRHDGPTVLLAYSGILAYSALWLLGLLPPSSGQAVQLSRDQHHSGLQDLGLGIQRTFGAFGSWGPTVSSAGLVLCWDLTVRGRGVIVAACGCGCLDCGVMLPALIVPPRRTDESRKDETEATWSAASCRYSRRQPSYGGFGIRHPGFGMSWWSGWRYGWVGCLAYLGLFVTRRFGLGPRLRGSGVLALWQSRHSGQRSRDLGSAYFEHLDIAGAFGRLAEL